MDWIKDIVAENVRMGLFEITASKKYEIEKGKGKTNLDFDNYVAILSIDPTYDAVKGIVGKYGNWLLRVLKEDDLFDNELTRRLRIALEQFDDGVKRGIMKQHGLSSDIGTYKNADALLDAIDSVMKNGSVSASDANHMDSLQGQYELVKEDSEWMVVAPKTWKAERFFGSGTEWCTVANENFFSQYMRQGQLYITYPKNGNKELKMQFHFASGSFADWQDNVEENPKRVIASVVGEGEEYEKVCALWDWNRMFNSSKYVRICEIPGLLKDGVDPHEIFDHIEQGGDGTGLVRVTMLYGNGLHRINYLKEGWRELASEMWFGNAGFYWKGYARVGWCKDGVNPRKQPREFRRTVKYNFLDVNGGYLSEVWFDDADDFRCKYPKVRVNGKYNYIGTDGKYVSPVWFDRVVEGDDKTYTIGHVGNEEYAIDVKDYGTGDIIIMRMNNKTWQWEPIVDTRNIKENKTQYNMALTEKQIDEAIVKATLMTIDEAKAAGLTEEQIEAEAQRIIKDGWSE